MGRVRIRNLDRHLAGVGRRGSVVLALDNLETHRADLQRAGFSHQLPLGETILPAGRGPTSRYNAEGRWIVHRDQPKEQVTREQEWRWHEWHGPYERVERTRIVDAPYWRYPRTLDPPPSIELSVAQTAAGSKAIVSPALPYDGTRTGELLHRVNLFRDLLGECVALTENLEPLLNFEVRRLNWDVLPQGELPWERFSQRVRPLIDRMGPRTAPVAEHRLKLLTETHSPDRGAVGRAGFRGYLIFGFTDKNVYIVESLQYGHATYVFGGRLGNPYQDDKGANHESGPSRRACHPPRGVGEEDHGDSPLKRISPLSSRVYLEICG